MRSGQRRQLALTLAAVAVVFYVRLARLPGSSPYELFLFLNIVVGSCSGRARSSHRPSRVSPARSCSITVDAGKDRGLVTVRVSDTGVGIQADYLPFVFEKFRQADTSTTRTYGGVGLGLAVVKHLVGVMGGEIAAESAGAGKGASFLRRFPAHEERQVQHPQSPATYQS